MRQVRRVRPAKHDIAGSPDAAVAELAARQWGVVENAELWRCGLSRDAVARRLRAGLLHEVHPGVYAYGHAGLSLRGRFLAAAKAAGPDAALSHRSCAVMWQALDWDESWLPEVTIPMRGARQIPGVIVHRTRVPFHVMRFDGIPLMTPARMLLDLATLLSYTPLRRAVREMMARKRVTVRELVAVRGRKGGAMLTRVLADGYVPTRSELEDAVHDVILQGGFRAPVVNRDLRLDGKPTRPDFLWPDLRLVVEADGRAWHENDLAREDDAERQARLEAAGFRVLRVTWQQAIARPAQTVARLRAAGAPRP